MEKQEYHAMVAAASEITWLRQLLQQLQFGDTQATKFICDNQVAFHIASNTIFHKQKK